MTKALHHAVLIICMTASLQSRAISIAEQIDSLRAVLNDRISATEKIDTWNELAYAFRRISSDSTMKYARMAMQAARALSYQKGLAYALKNIGIAHFKAGAPPDSIYAYNEKTIEVAKRIPDYYLLAACYNNIALVKINELAYHQALQHFFLALEVFDEHIQQNNLLKCLLISNIGAAYYHIGQYHKALQYMQQGISLGDQLNLPIIRSIFTDELAQTYVGLGRTDEAIELIEEALALQQKLEDYESQVETLSTYAEINILQGAYQEAEKYAIEAGQIALEHQFPRREIAALIICTQALFMQNRMDEAFQKAQDAFSRSQRLNAPRLKVDALKLLADIAASKQDYQQAYHYLDLLLKAQETVKQQERSILMTEAEAKNWIENREKEQQAQIASLSLQSQQRQRQVIFLLIATFLLLILSVLSITQFLGKRKVAHSLDHKNKALEAANRELRLAEEKLNRKNEELNEYIRSNMQLENFAYLASHDLKTPLRTIISFTQLLERKLGPHADDETKEFFAFIQDATRNLNMLIQDLLAYSKVNNTHLRLEYFSPEGLLNDLQLELSTFVKEHNGLIRLDGLPTQIKADKGKIRQVFQNLITNAIKFSRHQDQPLAIVSGEDRGTHWLFAVKDNGVGIAREYHEKIFLIFQRLHTKDKFEGSGMGLSICKKIVDQHGGEIWLESEVGRGSTFYFMLPKS